MAENLVKQLRWMEDVCKKDISCPVPCINECLFKEAADAIEELSRKEKFHAFLWNTIQPNEMEAYLTMYNSGNEKEKTE